MRTAIMSALQLAFTLFTKPPCSSRRYPYSSRTTTTTTSAYHRLSRDRIGSDGQLQSSEQQSTSPPNYVIGSPIPDSPHPAPDVPPPTLTQLESLAKFVTSTNGPDGVLIITGAGCSTESNVPDYRGPAGAYNTGFKPMTHQNFMASEKNRSRYWARSFAGWQHFSSVKPNAAHEGIAALQAAGLVGHVITQNVDRLHQKAGSERVLELHGTTHEVCCMSCRASTPRNEVQRWLAGLNPHTLVNSSLGGSGGSGESEEEKMLRAGTTLPLASLSSRTEKKINLREAGAGVLRPDGDVELPQYSNNFNHNNTSSTPVVLEPEFKVPPCPACGGILKPDVVFFGDSLPPKRTEMALNMAKNASRVLVVGSSLAVWSAYRLIKAAKEQGRPDIQIAVVNVGPTRGDDIVDLKLEVRAGDAMKGLKDLLL